MMAVYIYGKFKDIAEQDVYVDIWSSGYNSSSTFEIEDSENADIYFSDDPIHITADSDNITDELIKHTCSISFLSKVWLGDYLFASNPDDIKVLVYTNNTILFAGFATPVSFSQDFSQQYNEFTLECIDLVTRLNYYYYLNNNYDLALLNAGIPTFREAINRMHLSYTFNSPRKSVTTNSIYVTSDKTKFSNKLNLRFNDLVFLGGSENDIRMEDEALESMLRYFGWRIVQQGATIMLYDPSELLRSHGTKATYNLSNNASYDYYNFNNTTEIREFPNSLYDISMSDVYSQMKIMCKTTSVDNPIQSMFNTDDIINNRYSSRSLYMTELGHDGSKYSPFKSILTNKSISGTSDSKAWSKEWYFRFLTNNNWIFNDANGNNIENLNYANQCQYMQYLRDNSGSSLLCELTSYDKVTADKQNVESKSQSNKYVYISVNGNGSDDISNRYPTYDNVHNDNGMIVYNNYQNVNFSSSDSNTTNYLVFTGKIQYIPRVGTSRIRKANSKNTKVVVEIDEHNTTFKDLYDNKDSTYMIWEAASGWYNTNPVVPVEYEKVAKSPFSKHYYTQLFHGFESSFGMSPIVDLENSPSNKLQYNYSCEGSDSDNISKLSILVCKLQIGSKYLKENFTTDRTPSTYSWVSDSSATFTLGIDPQIGDNILGTEFDLANNISKENNLDVQGMAIPIPFGTNLAGELKFSIIGLVDAEWDEVTKKTKRFLGIKIGTKWKTTSHFILSHVQSVVLKDLNITLVTDGGGIQSLEDKDLVYISDENADFVRNIYDIDFDIHTGLTSEEAYDLNMGNSINMNTVYNNDNSICTGIVSSKDAKTKKAEIDYIDRYYDFFANPQKIINYNMRIPSNVTYISEYMRFAKCNNVCGTYCMNKEIDYDCRQRLLNASGFAL